MVAEAEGVAEEAAEVGVEAGNHRKYDLALLQVSVHQSTMSSLI